MLNVRRHIGVVAIVCAGSAAGCATASTAADRVAGGALDFVTPTGGSIGSGVIWQDPLGIMHVDAQVRGLQPGQHGIHFHAVGRCDGAGSPAFSSAGAHFNPGNRMHGLSAADGPHAGDAPNLTVGSDGRGRVNFTTDRVSLTSGPTSLDDADGSSLVIHALGDDQVTDPSGNSGARIACAVVRM
ncbi:MAG: superoxide dismutase family protein [Gemmatimonadaceae bacterium]